MNLHGIELVCPRCRGELTARGQPAAELRCAACAAVYPVLAGIPDLRVFPDPYLGLDEDRAKGLQLDRGTAGMGFAEAVDTYYRGTPAVPPAQAGMFRDGLLAAGPRATRLLADWEAIAGPPPAGGALLDVGCGTAPLLAASPGSRRIGVDIAFRWLVVARRRLEEAGAEAALVCACAEALPFPPGVFDRVALDSAVEHLREPAAGLAECRRVLRPDGSLFVVTPNRASLGPDPHTGLWAGGLLPRRAVEAWCRRRGVVPPHRSMVTAVQLDRLLSAAGLEVVARPLPTVPPGQRAAYSGLRLGLLAAYGLLAATVPGRALLRRVGPWLQAAAVAGAEASGPSACSRKKR